MSVPTEQPTDDWLEIAKDAYESSTTYSDANYRKVFERNIALFQSRHPDGSKYKSSAYKSRSRLFRPKTKSVVRKNEAAASAAFFANVDVVTIEPENDADQMQVIGAELMNEVVNYRLTKTIPWFLTVMGALQEAQVIGIVCSYQYWMFKERATTQKVLDPSGEETEVEGPPEIEVDKPCIDLMPVENYRFDPGAAWTDVVGTSPYFIRVQPMRVIDVKARMKEADPKTGQAKWRHLEDGEIRAAMVDYDTIRQARETPKQDPLSDVSDGASLKDYEMVYCHENFVRRPEGEVVYWTLGTEHMLTDPVPLKEVYFHNIRPFVIGCAVLEAHKAVPDSLVGIGSELQKEANDINNQRRDNVSLVLNKRYIVKRGAQVDTDSLLRNVSGGVTLANDPEKDVREMEFNDVTGSAYQEQDRVNVDFDELVGNFSQSSVQTNRKLNETVGGMELASGGASAMTEYLLRTFVETWMEPVLNQLVKLEQAYENDQVVMALAGAKAKLSQKYGIDQATDNLLNASLTVRVSMGMGATDPQKKLGRFMFALKTYGEAMQLIPNANQEAIQNEIFGLAGYKGGAKFFGPSAPNMALQQQMQEMQQHLQQAMQEAQKAGNEAEMAKIAAAQANLKAAQSDFKAQAIQAKSGIDLAIANHKPVAAAPDMKPALDKIKNDIDARVLDYDKQIAILKIQNAELTAELKLTKAEHGAQIGVVQSQIGLKDQAHAVDMKQKDVAMQGQEVKHTQEKDKEVAKGVEKKVAERPDMKELQGLIQQISQPTADTMKEMKALIQQMAKPRTKKARKDASGAWIVEES